MKVLTLYVLAAATVIGLISIVLGASVQNGGKNYKFRYVIDSM